MYEVDEHDVVVPLLNIPGADAGAPCPLIACNEGKLVACYYLPLPHPDFDGTNPQGVDPAATAGSVCILEASADGMIFGPPNDEALHGHPLYSRGLKHYGVHEIVNSSWIRLIEARNRICFPRSEHRATDRRHIVICFHDSTLEFVTRSWKHRVVHGTVQAIFSQAISAFE